MLTDGYSGFGFFQALAPQDLSTGSLAGIAIDRRGYETVTFVVNVGAATSAGAMSADNRYQLMLEHYNSTAGAYSEVYPSQMIHDVVGGGGAYSTLNSGIFQSLASYTDAGAVYKVGYKGPHRTVRIRISEVGAPSVMSVGAVAILGKPSIWPVNEPVGE